MTVYYITTFLVLVFSCLALPQNFVFADKLKYSKPQFNTKLFLSLSALVLILVAGLRYYVGTDFGHYYNALQTYPPRLWDSILELDEPGFAILASIIAKFTNDGAVFIFTASVITIGILLYTTYKNVDTYVFSSLLFIFAGIWSGTFNGVRQYFAAAIIMLGHRYIFEKKFWKYLFYVFLAFLVHKSAIIMIVPYFILRNKVSFKNIAIMTIGSIILLYNYEFIFSFIGALKDETIDTSYTYMTNRVSILRILVSIVPAVFSLVLYLKTKVDAEQTFHINILILYALLSVIGMNSPYISRVNIYLSVLIPISMGKLVVFKDKKLEMLMKTIIMFLFFVFWYFEISKDGNFRFIWQR